MLGLGSIVYTGRKVWCIFAIHAVVITVVFKIPDIYQDLRSTLYDSLCDFEVTGPIPPFTNQPCH